MKAVGECVNFFNYETGCALLGTRGREAYATHTHGSKNEKGRGQEQSFIKTRKKKRGNPNLQTGVAQ